MAYQSIKPNDGKVLKGFECLTPPQLDRFLAGEQHSCKTWRHKSYEELALVLNKADALLRAQADDFAKLETLETGKRINESHGNVKFSGDSPPQSTGQHS